MAEYYGKEYFEWQREVGEFGGHANLFKFEKYIKGDDAILDFGCGGGFLLSNINTSGEKIGVEINDVARKSAQEKGIKVFKIISDIEEDEIVDVIISNHALEHVDNPATILAQLKNKLKKGGKIIFVVPFERQYSHYEKDNRDMHLYTWGPQQLYNLFKSVGYNVKDVDVISHRWMPKYRTVQRIFGWKVFHIFCRIYGSFVRNIKQIRIYATKD